MSDDETGIDFAILHTPEQGPHVPMHVGLAHFEDQAFAKRGAKRDLIEHATVNPGNRDDSALAARLHDLTQYQGPIKACFHPLLGVVIGRSYAPAVRLQTDGIDARIRTATASHPLQLLHKDRKSVV